jgi:hypothetical protein
MNLHKTVAPGSCLDIPRLLQFFEGLGENCDFGVVQRAIGIEPLGLLRFGGCTATDIAQLLQTRFQTLGAPGDLWLEVTGTEREYWVRSHHSSFLSHTDRYADRDDAEAVLAAQIEKTIYLKTKLIRDLSASRRLFVFKGPADIAEIREIVAQLQTYGPNCLLWICVADAEHSPGCVERLSDGLLRGFVSRYGTYDEAPSIPVEEWVAVCANAYRLWRNAEPPVAPHCNLISEAAEARSCRWFTDLSATTRIFDKPAPTGGVIYEHRLDSAELTSVYRVVLPITSGGKFVFSAWIRIPEQFRGRHIAAVLPGFASVATWTADLKSRKRWQRIWVAADVPIEERAVACDIIAAGDVGSAFFSATWCLERGSEPLGYGFRRM